MARASSGLFPSCHHAGTSQVVEKMYFSTSSKRSHPNHLKDGPSHGIQALSDKAKYKEIAGRHAITKPIKPCQAPLATRDDACTYNRTFTSLPLGGAAMDRDLARLQKEAARGGGQVSIGKVSDETTNRREYVDHMHEDWVPTKGGGRPRGNLQTSASDGMLGNVSTAKGHFPTPEPVWAARCRGVPVNPPNPGGAMPGHCHEAGPMGNDRSSYQRGHGDDPTSPANDIWRRSLPHAGKPRLGSSTEALQSVRLLPGVPCRTISGSAGQVVHPWHRP